VSAVLVGSVETPDCEGTVVWTYRYTACDGTSADWTYTYTVDYTSALPADITDGCGRTVSAVLVGSVETPDPLTWRALWYGPTERVMVRVPTTYTYTEITRVYRQRMAVLLLILVHLQISRMGVAAR
jgi:hypothetical protein